MNKKTIKILSILLTSIIVMSMMSTAVFAKNTGNLTAPGSIGINYQNDANNKVTEIGGEIIGILQTAGVVVAVIILIVLGIKYMMGSTAEKAEYKKTLMPYFIGALLIFGAVAVSEVVIGIATGLGN